MTPPGGRLLVVDDEELIRTLVLRHLNGRGLVCEAASDGRHGLALASTGAFDAVLSDIEMPGFDGLALARELTRLAPSVPVVLMSGRANLDHAVRAMRYGVADLLLKPFHLGALDEAVDRLLVRRRALREADEYRRTLQRRIEELAASRASDPLEAALAAMTDAVERRGGAAPGHGRRTRAILTAMQAAVPLEPEVAIDVAWAGFLHHVGLAGLPDGALRGASARTAEDEAAYRTHPDAGAALLRSIPATSGAAPVVAAHREHWDGTGFPRGLRGDAIPLAAQRLAVAAAAEEFLQADALRTPADAAEFLQLATDTRYSPEAVAVFLAVPEDEIVRARSLVPAEAAGLRVG